MTPRRLLAVALAGAVLRELLPHLARLADYCDPAGSAPGWTALPDERVYVPRAWVETDAHVHGAWCHPSADGCPDDLR